MERMRRPSKYHFMEVALLLGTVQQFPLNKSWARVVSVCRWLAPVNVTTRHPPGRVASLPHRTLCSHSLTTEIRTCASLRRGARGTQNWQATTPLSPA